PWTLSHAALQELCRVRAEGFDFSLLDAHYLYPDGVAAAMVARKLGIPFVLTARGSDVTLLSRYSIPRRLIQWASSEAAAIIAVCRALKNDLVQLGVDPDKITVLRNGVDLSRFRQDRREATRRELGLTGRVLLSVGWLIPRKRHDLAIRVLNGLPNC